MRRDDSAPHLNVHIVARPDDPDFETGFTILDEYFGSRGEMESREVISRRFDWHPAKVSQGFSLDYQLAVIRDAENEIAAVGDYSVILDHAAIEQGAAAVVHLSHIWVNPKKPGRGIVKHLMHTLTTQAAKQALLAAGFSESCAITLAAEMEPYEAGNEERIRRLKVFLHCGLVMVDPASIAYYQPDFRQPQDIDQSGGAQPLLLTMMLRRVGRETQTNTSAGEIRHIVNCLYHMYAQGIRAQDMQSAYATLQHYPAQDVAVPLLSKLA